MLAHSAFTVQQIWFLKTWLLLCTLLTHLIWSCNFFLLPRMRALSLTFISNLLTAPQAVPKSHFKKCFQWWQKYRAHCITQKGMANTNKPHISFSTQSRNFWITLHITILQPNDSTFQHWKRLITCCSHMNVNLSVLSRYSVYSVRLTWLLNRSVSSSSNDNCCILLLFNQQML